MKSMKINKEEKKAVEANYMDGPDYPYGLELHIDSDTFKKLGMTEPPNPGQEFMVLAKASVQDVHQSKHADGKDHIHFRLQIEEMDLKEKEPEKESKSAEKVLYGE